MNEKAKREAYFLYFTLPIVILLLLCSGIGILKPDFYKRETANWMAQCIGQDFSNALFIAPILVVTAFLSARGSKIAKIIWAGTMITNVYSFFLYCFAVHFNALFHIYCLILGLSVYALIVFSAKHFNQDFPHWFSQEVPRRAVGVFLLVMAAMFYFLWLYQSLPAAIAAGVPIAVLNEGLLTNPVHVLDFSFYLPLIILAAVLIIRKKRLGFFIAPMMLVFALITCVNIISLSLVTMVKTGIDDLQKISIFTALGIICILFNVLFLRKMKKV